MTETTTAVATATSEKLACSGVRVFLATTIREASTRLVKPLESAGAVVFDSGWHRLNWWKVASNTFEWTPEEWRKALDRADCTKVYEQAMDALIECDVCVLVGPRPNGEAMMLAGMAIGMGKRVVMVLGPGDLPPVMYRAAEDLCVTLEEVLAAVADEAATLAQKSIIYAPVEAAHD